MSEQQSENADFGEFDPMNFDDNGWDDFELDDLQSVDSSIEER